jgi:hypothetical protein
MKINLLLIIFTFLSITHISAQELSFEYDNAGNQTVRQWICVNCPRVDSTNPIVQDQNTVQNKNFNETNFDELTENKLSVYPNPVTEIVNVKWWNNNQIYVNKIEVFTLSGVLLFSKTYSEKEAQTSISFLEFAAGSYLLKATHTDNKQQVIKLFKQ